MSVSTPEIRTIRGREYRLYPFGFDGWARLSAELAAISGPAAGVLLGLSSGDPVDVSSGVRQVAEAVLSGVRGGLLDRLCGQLAYNRAEPGSPDKWVPLRTEQARSAIWAGHYDEGLLVLAWLLGVTYSGFLAAGGSIVSELSELLGVDGLLPAEAEQTS